MNTKEAIEFAEMTVTLARRAPDASAYRVARNVAALYRLGREAQTHAENVCNYPMPEGKDERKRASIRKRAIAVLSDIRNGFERGATIEVHGDPRGSCLQITLARETSPLRF